MTFAPVPDRIGKENSLHKIMLYLFYAIWLATQVFNQSECSKQASLKFIGSAQDTEIFK